MWYKYRVIWRSGLGEWEYVQTDNIDDYLEELSYKPAYGAMEVFNVEYHIIDKVPKEVIATMMHELAYGVSWRLKRINELNELLRN